MIFLVPLIAIMLIQSLITIGTLVMKRVTGMMEESSVSMMNRLVENRKVILQNDMNQRWASIHDREALINGVLERYLDGEGVGVETVLGSGEMRSGLLGVRRLLRQGFRPGYQSRQRHGSASGAGQQAPVQEVGHPPGHLLDHPLPYGGAGQGGRGGLFL